VEGLRVALTDGAAHAVDSSELAFKLACQYAFRDAYNKASPTVLEPIMAVEVCSPLPPVPVWILFGTTCGINYGGC